ncbi:hypothetical protein I317_02188 [Kwoniella heveanensis CBS 569]|nr:hypothetical protein I317_02188 [Kwoniella heveanensis CBS 569]
MAAQAPGPSVRSSTSAVWALPATIEPRAVLPDRYTDPSDATSDKLKGKESDPGRMGVFVCLLDDRPHLHPSLLALHRHRLNAHQIPLPPDPNNDLPIPSPHVQALSNSEVSPEDVDMSSSNIQPTPTPTPGQTVRKHRQEWFTWKFTQEEESRRKAYLPLA